MLLSLLFLLFSHPLSAHAVPHTDETTAAPDEVVSSPVSSGSDSDGGLFLSQEAAGGIREVTDLREENVKHFSLTNGKYTAVSYATPVHRMDASGAWQDIDNRLALTAVKNQEFYATSDGRVHFAKDFTTAAPLFTLTESGYAIGMAYTPNQLEAGELVTPLNRATTVTNAAPRASDTVYDTLEEAARIDNRSELVYTNVKPNTDLEYVLVGNDVKENIIVKAAGTSYAYRFTLSLTGLTATLTEAGAISLCDSETGEEKYVIPAPYMYDASGAISYDVAYTLTAQSGGSYILTVTASNEWINASDRAFPVTIDPTVTMSTYFYDTYISSTIPYQNYNSSTTLRIASNAATYIKFALPSVPSGGIVVNGDLYVMPSTISAASFTIGAYQMTEEWYSTSITWNSASAMTNFGMATTAQSYTALTTTGQYTAINLKALTKAWYNGTATNYGIALTQLVSNSHYVLLHSDEAESAQQPYFTVKYIIIPEGPYYIENIAALKYMDVEGPSTISGAAIQQWSFHEASQAKWKIIHVSNGFFKIQSLYSGLYVGVDSSNISEIKQFGTLNDYTLWEIQETSSENYRFTNKATAKALASSANTDGANLTTCTYSDNTIYTDEWNIFICSYYLGKTFNNWNSDARKVWYWDSSPSLYKENQSSISTFYFDDSFNTAITQWNNVLPISISVTNDRNNADIECYGLNEAQYKALTNEDWVSNRTGLTVSYGNFIGYVLYANHLMEVKVTTHAYIYIMENSRTLDYQNKTATHELGHALGYRGHSSTSTDVMCGGSHQHYQLSSTEIAHLLQCYEMFLD